MLSIRKAVRSAISRLKGMGVATDTVVPRTEWRETFWGGPMPDFASIVRRQRLEH